VNGIVDALGTLFRLEGHSNLNGTDIGLWGWDSGRCRGGIRFIATRRGNFWDVEVVDKDSSVLPDFDDMIDARKPLVIVLGTP